ncbi:MAG: signal peptidase I [Pseudomonadota bacterium]
MRDWLERWHSGDRKRLLKWGIPLLGFGLLLQVTNLGVNYSASLPYTVFLTVKGWQAAKGDLVAINQHCTKYYPPGARFTKRIVGFAGDKVSNLQETIWINGKLVGPLLKQTAFGRPLTPLVAPEAATIIPEGYVFVMTEHARSFDSRYQEFGLVPVAALQGRALVLW